MNFKPKRVKERIEVLKKDPKLALEYAGNILRGRWPEAEPYIMKDPESASRYATHVMREPWPEAEPYILKSFVPAMEYAVYTKRKLWPELEKIIDGNPDQVKIYRKLMRHYTY
jgi:hypothetical protein